MTGRSGSPIPRLVPNPPARTLRLLGRFMGGIREVTDQIEPYTAWWDEQNQRAADAAGPLLVAVGDSTAIGIGASSPANGYVGLLLEALTRHDRTIGAATRDDRTLGAPTPRRVAASRQPWRAVNLGLSGARLQDALDRQLPVLADLVARGLRPEVVVCCIGTNDLVWGRDVERLRSKIDDLAGGLPPDTIVGTLAGGSARARLANRALRRAADRHELHLVDPWSEPNPGTGPRLAADRFHPNDLGYRLMATPFARRVGVAEHLRRPEETSSSNAAAKPDPEGSAPGSSRLHGSGSAER